MSGDRIRRFKLGARIGGRFSVLATADRNPGRHPIYLVWDHRAWCPLACKVLRSTAKAEREAETLSAVAHPNIVRHFGVAEPAFLLLEFLEGSSLDRLIDGLPEGRLSVSDALRVAIHLGGALAHVHDRGYLHLDVKPANVIVAHNRPILFDFGSARRIGDERPPDVVGTDAYIAPEECLREAVGPAADVFGFGVTLYELLTGELPFAEGTKSDPFPQTDRPPVSARTYRKALPKGLDDLLLACLAREPAARPGLPDLLPRLHDHIRSGARMWPAGFRPGMSADAAETPDQRKRKGKTAEPKLAG